MKRALRAAASLLLVFALAVMVFPSQEMCIRDRVTTYAATQLALSSHFLHPLLAILLSGTVGGLLMLIPGFLKAKFDTNIVVSTLMLNSIYLGIGLWLLKDKMLATDISVTASPLFAKSAKLPYLFSGTRITVGFFMALLAAVLVYVMTVSYTHLDVYKRQ